MLETIQAWKETVAKKRAALSDELDLDEFLSSRDFTVVKDPFPHVVVDNVFRPELYARINKSFSEILGRGVSQEADLTRFKPFLELNKLGKEWEYDGYLYVPSPGENPELKLFYSLEWNLLFSRLFRQPTDWTTSLAFHHHPPGNRTGFVHNDYSLKRFSITNTLPNGVIHKEMGPQKYPDPALVTSMRVIAILIYLGDDAVSMEDGGGTGLYAEKGLSPVTIVAPRPNRLLAFQISPRSFHAFQTNQKVRNSLTQWFHMVPAWCERRYGHV